MTPSPRSALRARLRRFEHARLAIETVAEAVPDDGVPPGFSAQYGGAEWRLPIRC